MKKIMLLISLSFMLIGTGIAQEEIKKLVTVSEGEYLVSDESSIIGATGDNYCIVTRSWKDGKKLYYIYTKNGKKGPFLKEDVVPCNNPDTYEDMNCVYENENINVDDYVKNEDGQFFIEFRGNKYGPYDLILAFANTENTFYAVITNKNNTFLFSPSGKNVQVAGVPENLIISPDGTNAAVKTTGTMSVADMQNMANTNPQNIDVSQFSKVTYHSITGKKVGPMENEQTTSWFSNYSNVWLLKKGDDIYTDGVLWKTIEGLNNYSFWFVDKTHYAFLNSNYELEFADGKKFKSPVNIRAQKNGNTVTLRWISIENNNIMLCKKTL